MCSAMGTALSNLHDLDGKKLNGYAIHLGEVKQLRMSGWKGFTLYLKDSQGLCSCSPVIKGIFSVGGKDGVRPWMDLQYWEQVEFPATTEGTSIISLSGNGLNRKLFQFLATSIPPGGHLMVSYEDEQELHNDTLRSLHIGIPPALTPLGRILFVAGFEHVKNWYLSEGGFEGPRKLWAEKALSETVARGFLENTARQVHGFLGKKIGSDNKNDRGLEEAARHRATEILEIVREKLG